MNKEILRIAIPSIITNITIPLLSLIDVSIVGHLDDDGTAAPYIGAIAVGGLIFNMVYWIFNFLRMGTSGLTAQAYGRRDAVGQMQVLRQAIAVSLTCGVMIFLIQRPIEALAYRLIAPSEDVWLLAVAYFRIRVWAAPAVLILFSMNGWFVGMQNSRYPMVIAILQNLINIAASMILVFVFHWKVEGVALGTVISQYFGLVMAYLLWRYKYRAMSAHVNWRGSLRLQAMGRFFTVNRDIFFRMICIISITCSFTAFGARQGNLLLAVNTLLIQLFTLFSYFLDGFALSGEALAGKYIGARKHDMLMRCTRNLFLWALAVSLLFTLLYSIGGSRFLALLTNDEAVIQASQAYYGWVLSIPLVSFAAFIWDGIFIGATATRQMLYTLIVGTALFFGLYFLLPCYSDNQRLWLSFIAYLAARSVVQSLLAIKVLKNV